MPRAADAETAFTRSALLVIDVINDLDFDGGEALGPFAEELVGPILTLKRRFREAGLPVIYVNDNFGNWRSDFRATVDAVCGRACRGRAIARALKPEDEDLFVLKPKHSGFHHTVLPLLLHDLGVDRVVLCGIAGNICVAFTAHDALMHNLRVAVPRDAVASESSDANDRVLGELEDVFGVDTRPAAEVAVEPPAPG
ncbi:cysteine hydrolase family protein [Phycisphaera mikurensis]|uniref:Isochorismatase family protein n=1 Tax=Phycisphaera mikurensis (strain NBRC 102666 / KCTC 22515 / FYK2301M01) TaxID=1142394 RepID=I0IDK4_PHYMF|nr:isochorismatase family cysteine hydrolase [Phycisphaera mikurensis]MBB6441162.1 nicotinamidase-related amidase [Phycisphaera mikurensis]BAM03342.1 isochorismatase family protein [Phycisphaera mikurensis NBRC 102666]